MKDATKMNLMSISKNFRLPFKDYENARYKYIIIDKIWDNNAYITLQDMFNDP